MVVGPLFELAAPAGESTASGADQPLRGVLYIVGAVSAIVCLGARPAGGPPTIGRILGSDAEWLIGPLIAGLLLLVSLGVDDLGGNGEAFVLPVLVVSVVIAILASRLPSVSTQARRLLILPFVLCTSDLFQSIAGNLDIGGLIGTLSDAVPAGIFGFVVAFAVLGPLVYYVMLVYAPRQVAEREGSRVSWSVRYALFLASSVLGLSWLRFF